MLMDRNALSLIHVSSYQPHNVKEPVARLQVEVERSCADWIRTNDLRVMSPTSCRCSTALCDYTQPTFNRS